MNARIGLGLALVVAAALRVAFVAATDVDPRATFHWDMTFYDLAALRFADGFLMRDFEGVATAKWSPGYPVLLGSAYWLLGRGLWVPAFLNVVLGVATVLGTFEIGRRLFDARVGVAAAWLLAVWPGAIFYAPLILTETTFVAFFTLVLLVWVAFQARDETRASRWLGFGALLGVTILVRGAAVLFLVVPLVLGWHRERSLARPLRQLLLAGLGMAFVILPWTVRNAVTLGAPVLISTQQAGMALTFAHSEAATGGMSMSMEGFRDELLREYRDLPQPEREIAENRAEVSRALRYMLTHPLRELSLVPLRWAHLVKHDHTGMTWATTRGEGGAPLRPVVAADWDPYLERGADFYFYGVLLLAAAGLPAAFAAIQPMRLVLPATLAYFAFMHGVLFAGDPRFHAPLMPVLAVLAAAGIAALARRYSR